MDARWNVGANSPRAVTVLYSPEAVTQRRANLSEDLSALASSLRRDLAAAPTLGSGWLPEEKAKLTRTGGRCRKDGTLLDFDPGSAREHRCSKCGQVYRGEADYRWWIMNYQLWLAERAVHGAALAAVTADPWAASVARSILTLYADRYLTYPNIDNVLGPTRLFFSTYLESIWLLQIATALDLLECIDADAPFGARLRERIIDPSAKLIAQYNEGDSNRQVWNNAALAAAGRLLGDQNRTEHSTLGAFGLTHHLRSALLPDGTWYEGENYHLFAHRGLWYGVTIAEAAGLELPLDLLARFQAAFRTPFVTALPDLTFPARRDSQYGVSLRQWRTAESCELGLARSPDDDQLRSGMHELYRTDVPEGDTGRARSTAEAERNLPGVRLTRASLGWKALLFANTVLPPLEAATPSSALLGSQGYGVLRRDRGRVYVALDYGHSGNGHGHPDRLNLWLVSGDQRVLEDPGTGSYTSPTLHWYRSTLAHNAPLVNGTSQQRVDGALLSYGEQDGINWISAKAEIAPGVVATRTIIVLDNCMVDDVAWLATNEVELDLPIHSDGELKGAAEWRRVPLPGGTLPTDGFPFVSHSMRASIVQDVVSLTSGQVRAWFAAAGGEWWRATAPGP
ncbi:MAG: heparinase II/III family protein, partial [Gemmatimonadaceae bacterium]